MIVEASGGYDRVLRDVLEDAQAGFSRVNSRQVRDFARAMGVIGKTDRGDAPLLATFGQGLQPPPPFRQRDRRFLRKLPGTFSWLRRESRRPPDDSPHLPLRHQERDPAPRAAAREGQKMDRQVHLLLA